MQDQVKTNFRLKDLCLIKPLNLIEWKAVLVHYVKKHVAVFMAALLVKHREDPLSSKTVGKSIGVHVWAGEWNDTVNMTD